MQRSYVIDFIKAVIQLLNDDKLDDVFTMLEEFHIKHMSKESMNILRDDFVEIISWGYPSKSVLAEIAKQIPPNSTVVEIGAGTGFWMLLLSKYLKIYHPHNNITLIATDIHIRPHTFYPIEQSDALDIVKKYKPDVVLCIWPSHSGTFPERVLEKHIGRFIYIGEDRDGCCAGNSFFDEAMKWNNITSDGVVMSRWTYLNDSVFILEKKPIQSISEIRSKWY